MEFCAVVYILISQIYYIAFGGVRVYCEKASGDDITNKTLDINLRIENDTAGIYRTPRLYTTTYSQSLKSAVPTIAKVVDNDTVIYTPGKGEIYDFMEFLCFTKTQKPISVALYNLKESDVEPQMYIYFYNGKWHEVKHTYNEFVIEALNEPDTFDFTSLPEDDREDFKNVIAENLQIALKLSGGIDIRPRDARVPTSGESVSHLVGIGFDIGDFANREDIKVTYKKENDGSVFSTCTPGSGFKFVYIADSTYRQVLFVAEETSQCQALTFFAKDSQMILTLFITSTNPSEAKIMHFRKSPRGWVIFDLRDLNVRTYRSRLMSWY